MSLQELKCQGNRLTYLELSANTALMNLICSRNRFSTDAMNYLFRSLHNNHVTEEKIALIGNTPEALVSDKEIATGKGWKVETERKAVLTTNDTSSVTFSITGYGQITIDWGDGTETVTENIYGSHTFYRNYNGVQPTPRTVTIICDDFTEFK